MFWPRGIPRPISISPPGGHALIISGALIWVTNVLVFSLWYWEMDRGGPGFRAAGHDGPPDFLFPQMGERELCRGWRPRFPDYLYVSLTWGSSKAHTHRRS